MMEPKQKPAPAGDVRWSDDGGEDAEDDGDQNTEPSQRDRTVLGFLVEVAPLW